MFVFFNNYIIKLALANPATQNPQDIENSKSHLAKLTADNGRLLNFLE